MHITNVFTCPFLSANDKISYSVGNSYFNRKRNPVVDCTAQMTAAMILAGPNVQTLSRSPGVVGL